MEGVNVSDAAGSVASKGDGATGETGESPTRKSLTSRRGSFKDRIESLASQIQESANPKSYLDAKNQGALDGEEQDTGSQAANAVQENDKVSQAEAIESLKRNVRRLFDRNEAHEKKFQDFKEFKTRFKEQMDELDIKPLLDRLDGQLGSMKIHLEERQNSLEKSQALVRQKTEKLHTKEKDLEDKLEEVQSKVESLQLTVNHTILAKSPEIDEVKKAQQQDLQRQQAPTLAEQWTTQDNLRSQLKELEMWKDTMMNQTLPDLRAEIKSQVSQLAGENELSATLKETALKEAISRQQAAFDAQRTEANERFAEVDKQVESSVEGLKALSAQLAALNNVEEPTRPTQGTESQSISAPAASVEDLQKEMLANALPKMQQEIDLRFAEVSKALSLRQNILDNRLTELKRDLAKQQGCIDDHAATLEKHSAQQQTQHEAFQAASEKRSAENVEEQAWTSQEKTNLIIDELAATVEGLQTDALPKIQKEIKFQVGELNRDLSLRQDSLGNQFKDLESNLAKQQGNIDDIAATLAKHSAQQQTQHEALKAATEKHVVSQLAGQESQRALAERESLSQVEGFKNQLADLEKNLAKQQGNFDAYTVAMQKNSAKEQAELQKMDKMLAQLEKDSSEQTDGLKERLTDLEQNLLKQQGNFDAYMAAMQKHSTKQQMELRSMEKQVTEQVAGLEAHKDACHQTWTQVERDFSEQAEVFKKRLADLEQNLLKQQGSLNACASAMEKQSAKQQADMQDFDAVIEKRLAEQLAESHKAAAQQMIDQAASAQLELCSLQGSIQELRIDQDTILSDKLPRMETQFQAQFDKLQGGQAKHKELVEELQDFQGHIEMHVQTLLANHKDQSQELGGVADRIKQLDIALQEALSDRDELMADTIPRIKTDSLALQTEVRDSHASLQEGMQSQIGALGQALQATMQNQFEELNRSRAQQKERLEQVRQESRREREDLETALTGKVRMVEASLQRCRDDQEGLLGDIVPAMQVKIRQIDSSLQTCCDDQRNLLGDAVPTIQTKVNSIETRLQTCCEETIPTMEAKVKKNESSLQKCCADQVALREDTVATIQAKVKKIEPRLQRCCDDLDGLLNMTIPEMKAEAKEVDRCLKDFGSLQDEVVYEKLPELETQLKLQVVKRLTSQKAALEEKTEEMWKRMEMSMEERQKEGLTTLETAWDGHRNEVFEQLETLVESIQGKRYLELEASLEKVESTLHRQKQELVKFEIALESRREEAGNNKTERKQMIDARQSSVPEVPKIAIGVEPYPLPGQSQGGSSTPRDHTPRSQSGSQSTGVMQHSVAGQRQIVIGAERHALPWRHGGNTTPRDRSQREHRSLPRPRSTGAIQKRTLHIDVVNPPGITPPASPAGTHRSPQKNGVYRRHPCWHECHLCSLGSTKSTVEDVALQAACCHVHSSLFDPTVALTA